MITLCLQAHTIEFQEYTADTIPSVSRNSFQGAFNISVGDAALGRPAVMFSLVHNYCFSPDFAIETGIHFSSWSLFAEIVQPANMGITAWLSNQYLLDIASVWYPIPALPLRVGVGPALRWHSVILTASGSVSRMSQGISIGAVVKVEYDCGRIAGTSAAWGGVRKFTGLLFRRYPFFLKIYHKQVLSA